MSSSRGYFVTLTLALFVALAQGCASSPPAVAADAVPISVKVVPSADTPPLISVETILGSETTGTWELWYFYDLRDPKSADPSRHLDADDYLKLSDAARVQYVPRGNAKWSISFLAAPTRSVDTELYVTVIAISSTGKKGSMGSAAIPAAP